MRINQNLYFYNYPISIKQDKSTPIVFNANPNSKLLNFSYNDFFVNISGYGKNKNWAYAVKRTADNATKKIREGNSSNEVLAYIAKDMKIANGFCTDITKRRHTGFLRADRKGFGKTGEWNNIELVTPICNKYDSYKDKLKDIETNPIKSPFYDIQSAKIETGNWIDYDVRVVHPDGKYVNNALDRVGGIFYNLQRDYISRPQNVTKEVLPLINSNIAEIRWIMAHSMPWERGSDAISNVFMRSIYKSMGIKTYPIKKGISLDLEAFCTPLEKYKKDFSNYFEKSSQIVE